MLKNGKILPDKGLSRQAIWKTVQGYANIAGVDITTPDFRAAALTNAIKKSDVFTAQKIAGHQSVTTTQRYDLRSEEDMLAVLQEINF